MNIKLRQIADHYGKDAQAVQCAEELSELACAILQYRRRRQANEKCHVIEEIADVEIMLEQIKHLYGIGSNFIDEIKADKIERQLERMEKENKNV